MVNKRKIDSDNNSRLKFLVSLSVLICNNKNKYNYHYY